MPEIGHILHIRRGGKHAETNPKKDVRIKRQDGVESSYR